MVVGAGPVPARWPHRATFGVRTTRTLPLPGHRAGTGPAPTFSNNCPYLNAEKKVFLAKLHTLKHNWLIVR